MSSSKLTLVDAIKSANIHKKVGLCARDFIKPNKTLHEIANYIETKINEESSYDINNPLKAGIAFPVGLSLNNCAAHYSPNYNEKEILLKNTDILKIDYGVHKNGVIIDSAFTLSFNPEYEEFINISRNLTKYAVSLCGPDVILGEIGEKIEEYVKSKEITINNKTYKLKTMEDLSGHLIAPYEIHAGKAVPNIKINYPLRMKEHEYYAIEPFLTTGQGKSILKEPNSHFMLKMNHKELFLKNSMKYSISQIDLYNIITQKYGTLPFCQKWLYDYNDALKELSTSTELLNVYPPIYDVKNSIISQFEHTVFIKSNGCVNLTQNEYY
jgi:methionyl aminopeptidase